MYILVEIIHTEFQYISLIEMQKYNWNRKRIEKRKTERKKKTFCPDWSPAALGVTNPFVPVARRGTKKLPFCPGLTFPVGKPGQQKFPNRDKLAFL